MKSLKLNTFKLSILFALIAQTAMAQKISFGPNVGTYIPNKYGNNYQDSTFTSVLTDAGDGERTIGLFIEYEKSKTLSLRGELNYFPDYTSFSVYNYVKKCTFCQVTKVAVIAHRTLAFVPTAKVSLPLGNKLKTSLAGGISINFQHRQSLPYLTENNGRDLGVWETFNALDEMVRPVVLYYHYGGSIQYGRFTLTGRYMKNTGKSVFNDIVVYGKAYKFYAQSKYLFLMLSYNMQGQLKKKQKKE